MSKKGKGNSFPLCYRYESIVIRKIKLVAYKPLLINTLLTCSSQALRLLKGIVLDDRSNTKACERNRYKKKPRLVCVTSVDIRNKESGERLWMKIF